MPPWSMKEDQQPVFDGQQCQTGRAGRFQVRCSYPAASLSTGQFRVTTGATGVRFQLTMHRSKPDNADTGHASGDHVIFDKFRSRISGDGRSRSGYDAARTSGRFRQHHGWTPLN